MELEEASGEEQVSRSGSSGVHEKRIFLAEDDPEMRRLVQQTLERNGHLVTSTGSGAELFERLAYAREVGIPVALVISDIRMPGLSGLEVLREVRARSIEAPVLLISAFCEEEVLSEAEQLGAAVVLSKPFDMEALLTVVDFLLIGASDSKN